MHSEIKKCSFDQSSERNNLISNKKNDLINDRKLSIEKIEKNSTYSDKEKSGINLKVSEIIEKNNQYSTV
jgi:hypothetical protein